MQTETALPVFDEARSEAFAERMMDMLNQGATAFLTSIGHRTGLFDAMRAADPATSAVIAERAGLDERYVREWLNGMTTARVLEHDPASGAYRLPDEHAAWLTREATPNNLAALAQYFGLMGSVEDRVVECFRNGGGVPYEAFGRFHEVMAEDSGQTVLPVLLDRILPLAPGLPERLREGIDVLDVGCGSGRALHLLAEAFPASRFTGRDLSGEAIGRARAEVERRGLENVRFEIADVADMEDEARFDLVTTFDAVHDQAAPLEVLRRIRRALRPDGIYLMQEIAGSSHVHENLDHPIAPLLYTISTMHCMTVSLARGGEGLGTMWGRQKAQEYLARAGFGEPAVHAFDHDPQNEWYVVRAA